MNEAQLETQSPYELDADFDTIEMADHFDLCDYLPAEFEAEWNEPTHA